MTLQLDLFETKKTGVIDYKEAPKGFIPVLKQNIHTPNVCSSCHARKLCVDNKDNWCLNNSCMSFKRRDGMGVVFQHSL